MAKETKTIEQRAQDLRDGRAARRIVDREYYAAPEYLTDCVMAGVASRVKRLIGDSKAIDHAARQTLASAGFDATPVEKAQRVKAEPATEPAENGAPVEMAATA